MSNVKTSKAFDEAGFSETARLVESLNENTCLPKSLQGEPPVFTQECPACEVGVLTPVEYEDEFMLIPRKPESGTVKVTGLQGMYCTNCVEIMIFPDQIRHNEKRIYKARFMKHSIR